MKSLSNLDQLSKPELIELFKKLFEENKDLKQQNKALLEQNKALQRQNQALKAQVKTLEKRVEKLETQLNQNSRNSSKSPSSDGPNVKKKSRKPGENDYGPPKGHKGTTRKDFGPADKQQELRPERCACGQSLSEIEHNLLKKWQVAELLVKPVEITEYTQYACTCPACGTIVSGEIPPEVPTNQSIGPRLQAWLSFLHVMHDQSYEKLELLCEELLGLPMTPGTLSKLFQQTSSALKASMVMIHERVQNSKANHCDETGWKLRGEVQYLYVATNEEYSYFWIRQKRNRLALQEGLSLTYSGVIHSDFHSMYHIYEGQGCWAHTLRDVEACIESKDGQAFGLKLRSLMNVFWDLWRQQSCGEISVSSFQSGAHELQQYLLDWLEAEINLPDRARKLKQRFLTYWDKMFYFVEHPETPPDNNRAERDLRRLVTNRKISGGNRQSWGEEFKTSVASVVMTCRKQAKDAIQYIQNALMAYARPHFQHPILFDSC